MSTIFERVIRDRRLLAIVFAACVRMGYFGFAYFPQLDDYIQYGRYPFVENPFSQIYLRIGLYAARPLASLGDIYVWGRFWGCMGTAFFIITLLHAVSAYVFVKTSEKAERPLGVVFVILYLLCPINFEGSYWISASSRIVVGLFFASVSAYCLADKKPFLSFVFQLAAMMLYEQVAVFSFAVSALIILRTKRRRDLAALFVNCSVFVLYYKMFSSSGSFGFRSEVGLNFASLGGIARAWGMFSLYTSGFARGLAQAGLYLIPIFIACLLVSRFDISKKPDMALAFAGILLFILPYLPFFVLRNANVSFRSCVVPLFGLAVFADAVLPCARRAVAFALAFVFLVVSVSDLSDYKHNYIIDQKIASYVAERLDRQQPNSVVGARRVYAEQNANFAEHIISVASSDWALTGCVREYTGDFDIPLISVNSENPQGNIISLFDFSY